MEELCHQLRYLPLLKRWATKANIRLLCEGKDKDVSTSTVVVSVVGFLVNSFSSVCLGINPVFRSDWSCWRPARGLLNLEFLFVRERGPILVPRATRHYPRVGSTAGASKHPRLETELSCDRDQNKRRALEKRKERFSVTFTPNGKHEFVPRDQVFP